LCARSTAADDRPGLSHEPTSAQPPGNSCRRATRRKGDMLFAADFAFLDIVWTPSVCQRAQQ
jgi:hypothetical protein